MAEGPPARKASVPAPQGPRRRAAKRLELLVYIIFIYLIHFGPLCTLLLLLRVHSVSIINNITLDQEILSEILVTSFIRASISL